MTDNERLIYEVHRLNRNLVMVGLSIWLWGLIIAALLTH